MMFDVEKVGRCRHLALNGIATGLKSIASVLLVLLVFSVSAYADVSKNKINRVKAAFVFNIAKFVTWPDPVYEARPNQLMLCFYRRDFLGRGFDSINGKKIHDRLIAKTVIKNLAGSKGCDIVFIPAKEIEFFLGESRRHVKLPVLTIADLTGRQSVGKAYPGVTLNLIRHGSSMGFEVNLLQVDERGLEMSSELLKLARIVSSENES